jgi:hypothetical protein
MTLHSKDLAAKSQAIVQYEGVKRTGRLIPGPCQALELAATLTADGTSGHVDQVGISKGTLGRVGGLLRRTG